MTAFVTVLLTDMGVGPTIVHVDAALLGLSYAIDVQDRGAVIHHTGHVMPLGVRVAVITAGIMACQVSFAIIAP